jgi:hypothetical protein
MRGSIQRIGVFVFILSICLQPWQVWSQDAPITLSSSVDKSRIHIGDLITYTITVSHDPDIEVQMPGLGENLGGFEIRDYTVHDPKKEKGRVLSQWDYIISTFLTGEFEIPPIGLQYTMPGDTIPRALATEKIKIVVESVKPSEAGDIRDIKPPVEIPRKLWHTLRWVVLGVGLALSAILVYYLYKRKKAGKSLLPVREIPLRPPHEIAYEALDLLHDSDLLENGQIKQFYIEISEIIRRYIEGRYFIIAFEMTTAEVLENLSAEVVPDDEYNRFQRFLDQCDLVKFAKVIPSDEDHELIMKMAYEIVDCTKVIVEEKPMAESDTDSSIAGDAPPDGAIPEESLAETSVETEAGDRA